MTTHFSDTRLVWEL